MKTFKVTYTTFKGIEKTLLVKANNENQAISNAKNVCRTGSNFINPVETDEKYLKPIKQGYSPY